MATVSVSLSLKQTASKGYVCAWLTIIEQYSIGIGPSAHDVYAKHDAKSKS